MQGAELFCGMGISALGLVTSGVELVLGVESEAIPVDAFNSQTLLPAVAVQGSVSQVPIPRRLGIISGGPVCKAFSPGATVFGTKGADDERNTFPIFLQDIEAARPRYVLIENTVGLRTFAGYLQELIGTLEGMGYNVVLTELDAYDFGVPQHRHRLVFLCSRRGKWIVPPATQRLDGPATVGDCLYDPPAGDPWPLMEPLSPGGIAYYLRNPIRIRKHPPLVPESPADTVTAGYAKGAPHGIVLIDGQFFQCGPRLAARLQGLPDEYDLSMFSKTAALRAIGNGFPYQVVEYCMGYLP
jgi:DNA (cytosine-5)-methyltransferase 1